MSDKREELDQGIELAAALEALREELEVARRSAAGKDVQFPISSLTVELRVAVTRTREGKAGFRVPFVGAELGGAAGRTGEWFQTVTVAMGSPVDRYGKPIKVALESNQKKG